jgi:hypothetical protein
MRFRSQTHFIVLVLLAVISLTCKKQSAVEPTAAPVPVPSSDTTSHDWVFDPPVYLGGVYNPSVLRDVVIVNDTMAYAVGTLYYADSLGQDDTNPYSLATWNGVSWKAEQIHLTDPCAMARFAQLSAACYLPVGILMASHGAGLIDFTDHGTITDCAPYANGSQHISVIGATSPTNIFTAGYIGSMMHFDGTTWKKIQTGTTIEFFDGGVSADGKHFAASGYDSGYFNSAVVTSDGNSASILWQRSTSTSSPFGNLVQGVCYVGNELLVASYYGVYKVPGGGSLSQVETLCSSSASVHRLRANGLNDVFWAGDNGVVMHFNGSTVKTIRQGLGSEVFYGLAVSQNLIIAVGVSYTSFPAYKGLICVAHRK